MDLSSRSHHQDACLWAFSPLCSSSCGWQSGYHKLLSSMPGFWGFSCSVFRLSTWVLARNSLVFWLSVIVQPGRFGFCLMCMFLNSLMNGTYPPASQHLHCSLLIYHLCLLPLLTHFLIYRMLISFLDINIWLVAYFIWLFLLGQISLIMLCGLVNTTLLLLMLIF